jgi:hypothetical protein
LKIFHQVFLSTQNKNRSCEQKKKLVLEVISQFKKKSQNFDARFPQCEREQVEHETIECELP